MALIPGAKKGDRVPSCKQFSNTVVHCNSHHVAKGVTIGSV